MFLYEFKCEDCGSIILLENDDKEKEIDCCPYCTGRVDYAPGKIEPVLEYTPREEK